MTSPPWPFALLSAKPFDEFSPSEYKQYVRDLYRKRAMKRKTPSVRIKKARPPYSARLSKKGNLTLRVNRSPKWLTREEVDQIAKDLSLPLNEVWVYVMKKRKETIRISTQEEEDRIAGELKGLDEVLPSV